MAWARQEQAPSGAAVVADHEVYPLGRLGTPWSGSPEDTLAVAVVLRPKLPIHLADVLWLIGGLAGAEAAEAVTGRHVGTWWPDGVVEAASRVTVGTLKAEVQLGPGAVRSAVLTLRFDLDALGVARSVSDELVSALLLSLDRSTALLDQGTEGCVQAIAAYDQRCILLGERVKVSLLPRGETRGVARRIDDASNLEVVSATGMVERISVDMLRRLDVVSGG